MAALRWLAAGYGYEITRADVCSAYANTVDAARKEGREEAIRGEIRALVESDRTVFMATAICREMGLA